MKKNFTKIILSILFCILSLNMIIAQDLVINSAPTPIIPGIYNTITIQSGGAGVLTGDVSVATSVTIEAGGALVCGAYKITGTATFTITGKGAFSYSGKSIDSIIKVAGTKTYGTDGIFIFSGTGRQNIGTGGFPGTVSALLINNPDTVYKAGVITIKDSLVIYQGTLDLSNNNLQMNKNTLIRNNSTKIHRINLRADNSDIKITIVGSQRFVVNKFDTQQNNVDYSLGVDVRINGTGNTLEKGSHITLNGYNLTINSSQGNFGSYGAPNYIDMNFGGRLIQEFTSVNTSFNRNIKVATLISNLNISKVSGGVGANPYVSVRVSDSAYSDLDGATNYITKYADVILNDFTGSPNIGIDFYYDNSDIVGSEAKLDAVVYNGSSWGAPSGGGIAFVTNNITVTGISTSTKVSAIETAAANLPNLIINTTQDFSSVTGYDSVIIQNGGVANVVNSINNIHSIIVEKGGRINCGTYTLSGINFEMFDSSYIAIGSPDGLYDSKATKGNIRFTGTSYGTYTVFIYNGTVSQSLGGHFPRYATIRNLVIDNPTQVTVSEEYSLSGTITLLRGKISGTSKINVTGPSTINNNAGVNAFDVNFGTTNVDNSNSLAVRGDSVTYFKSLGFDQVLPITLYQDVIVKTISLGFANRGHFILNGKKLILRSDYVINGNGAATFKAIIDDASSIVQQLHDTLIGKTRNYYWLKTVSNSSVPVVVKFNAGTMGVKPTMEIKVVAQQQANLPDATNMIRRYVNFNFANVSGLNYDASMTYINADIVGSTSLMEAGFWDGANWIESGLTADFGTKIASATSLTLNGDLAIGELHPVGLGETKNEKELAIYPIPSNGIVKIDGLKENDKVEVLNMLGNKMNLSNSSRNILDLTGNSGMYIVKIISNGKEINKVIVIK